MIREKERHELSNHVIADRMLLSTRWVKELWRRYHIDGVIPELRKPGSLSRYPRRRRVQS
jgi:hypothetical protein